MSMKKNKLLLSVILTLAVTFSTAQNYSGGSGTSGDPYQIANKADLKYLSENAGEWSKHFIQTADIAFNADETQVDWDGDGTATSDTEDQKGFLPIGNSPTNFNGSYDGKEIRISKQDLYGYLKIIKEES